jgi:excisionase family DNA binding protein
MRDPESAPARVTGPGEELPPARSGADDAGRVADAPGTVHSWLVDTRHAAALLCLSPRTLWTLQNCGEIPVVRIGRAVRFDLRDLERWIESQKRRRGRR